MTNEKGVKVLAAVDAEGGAAVFGVREKGGGDDKARTEIIAALVDRDGSLRGSPRVVRVTSGEVQSLDASRTRAGFAVAWYSVIPPTNGGDPSGFVAVARVAADGSTAEAPITLSTRKAGDPSALAVRVATASDGSMLVAGPSEGGPCTFRAGSPEGEPCVGNGWSVWRVDANGTKVLAHRNLDASPVSASFLALVGDELVATAEGMRGGLVVDVLTGNDVGPLVDHRAAYPTCGMVMRRFAVGDRVVTYCERGYCPKNAGDVCSRVRVTRRGVPETGDEGDGFVSMAKVEAVCVSGGPTVRLSWKGGALDVVAASRGAFTGQVLLARGDDGYERTRCRGEKVMSAPFVLGK